ncbi:MAG: nucleotidyltransferase family protein [Candidatus Thermoplasmatota archaeon]|nr:nucleotidyltransferase family protein [Candidatus Thermoplasmatota archaeon]
MSASSASDTCIILLGAGISRRYGDQKLLQLLGGKHLFRHALLESVRSICMQVVFVVNKDLKRIIQDEMEDYGGRVIFAVNREPEKGLSSSIAAGMKKLPRCGAVLLLAADQPLVSSALLNGIILKHAVDREKIVAACVNGETRNPALFPYSFFSELLKLKGDRGAKVLMNAHRENVICIATDADELMDIDTIQDLELARALYGRAKQ